MAARCSRLQEELAALHVVSDSARLTSEKPASGCGDAKNLQREFGEQRSTSAIVKRDETDCGFRASGESGLQSDVRREKPTRVLHAMVRIFCSHVRI